jgi:twinkle protein
LRLPENQVEPSKKEEAWKNVFGNDRWIFWDHFGSNDVDSVCNQVRFVANNFGAKYIFLDHISIIVSDGSSGDERKTLDAIMTRLRTLVQELDICLFLVSHLRRSNDSISHEEGGVTSLSQLRGSAGIGQLSDIVVGLERNGQSENKVERNLTTLRILKNRYTGETGPACYLIWDKVSSRLKSYTFAETQKLIAEEETRYNGGLEQNEEV